MKTTNGKFKNGLILNVKNRKIKWTSKLCEFTVELKYRWSFVVLGYRIVKSGKCTGEVKREVDPLREGNWVYRWHHEDQGYFYNNNDWNI